ncbi:MAG TPA: hypothetical protein VGR71_06800 [Nitrospira sp.]|nr:hypothetical protein [Nitrospira sp.]
MKWVWLACAAGLVVSCGTIGPPIPPEDVGVGPIIERQKAQEALDAKQREAADAQAVVDPLGQDVNLPPLRPVGTR